MDQTQIKEFQNCVKHNHKRAKFIQVNGVANSDNNNIFYCTDCINEDLSFKGINYLLIQQIIKQGENKIIQKWPPVNDYSILDKLIEQSASYNSSPSIVQQITNYFTELKDEFIRKVDFYQKKMINRALELPLGNESLLKQYQQISKITEFRQLLLELNKKREQNNNHQEQCKQFISQIESQKETNTKLLENLLSQSLNKQNLINFEFPRQLKESIFSIIEQINFFDDPNNNQNIVNTQQNTSSNYEKILKLISNKSNFCSESFLLEIKQKLQKLNSFFDNISFEKMHQDNKSPLNFSDLNNNQFENVQKYVVHSIKTSNDQEYQRNISQQVQQSDLMKIINNKWNFGNNSFEEKYTAYLIETYPFIKDFRDDQIISNQDKFLLANVIGEEQINNLLELILKKSELDRNNNTNNQTLFFYNKFENNLNMLFNKNHCKDLFNKFPIFDLIKQKQVSILNQFELQGTIYKHGNERIQIKRDENEIKIQVDQSQYTKEFKSQNINCVSKGILQKDKKYVFRIEINMNIPGYVTYIGLIPNEKADIETVQNENLSIRFKNNNNQLCQENNNGIKKYLKGNSMKLQNKSIIEIRVFLDGQKLEVLDYPNYQYKVTLEENKKSLLTNLNDLKFCLYLFDENTVSYIIKEVLIVEDFDD